MWLWKEKEKKKIWEEILTKSKQYANDEKLTEKKERKKERKKESAIE